MIAIKTITLKFNKQLVFADHRKKIKTQDEKDLRTLKYYSEGKS